MFNISLLWKSSTIILTQRVSFMSYMGMIVAKGVAAHTGGLVLDTMMRSYFCPVIEYKFMFTQANMHMTYVLSLLWIRIDMQKMELCIMHPAELAGEIQKMELCIMHPSELG